VGSDGRGSVLLDRGGTARTGVGSGSSARAVPPVLPSVTGIGGR
jgi:hypothetical protein